MNFWPGFFWGSAVATVVVNVVWLFNSWDINCI